ncbi:MAG TPA: protein kinase [Pirellulales bacterium]|nr:protein kinase [Pirellulales bacterium]
MADFANCPDQNTLERLLEGFLPDDTAVDLEHHLLGCPRCCHVARSLRFANEPKLDAIARTAAELADEQAVIEIADRVGMLRLPDRSTVHGETLSSGNENTLEGWDFGQILSPPESEEELGRFGAYRVLRVLGAGGMGLVWEAEDTQLRRRVALKVMKPSLAKLREHRERFLREARAAAAIDHSHIVTVYQVGEHRGLPFLAMQLLHGETLTDTLRREGALPEAECLRVGRQMAEALAVAHRRGLIHRDIKPANTWLEADGGWVKLVDFGLAQATADESHLTQTGVILGTPAFMSPEQARGDAVDPRSDLFSLGAVLYRMATGVGPFDGPNMLAVLTSLALRTPAPPRQINPAISPEFSDLIMRLLAKTQGDRPASAEAVVEAIRAIEQNARRPAKASNVQPSGQRRRRWPWVVAAAAAAAGLLAGIIVIIRNKDGHEVGRYPVPEEGSVSVVPAHGSRAARADEEDDRPLAVSEPPSLDQWLAGRKVLTVAKDGSGQFQTIQAALDALQPGEAVEVLDRGPYRETLLLANPRDVGLISRAGTIIEPGPNRRTFGPADTADFHYFAGVRGFRLHGISFVADDLKQLGIATYWVHCTLDGDLLIENCHFSSERPPTQELMVVWIGTAPPGAVCHVRECLFDTAPFINTSERPAQPVAVIERSWFRRTALCLYGPRQRTVLRHNVFDTTASDAFTLYHEDGIDRLEIYNNTVGAWMLASRKLTATGVVVRNNLFRTGITVAGDGALESLPAAVRGWQVGHNEYAQAPELSDQFPKSSDDFVGAPTYLSQDPSSSDYLRLASNCDEANRGIGGAWPAYLGALPPGPAPTKGDWFTRLIRVAPKLSNGTPSDSPSATSADSPSLDQ